MNSYFKHKPGQKQGGYVILVKSYWGWVWGHQGWGSQPGPGTGCCHSHGTSAAQAHICTATLDRTLGGASLTHRDCQDEGRSYLNGAGTSCRVGTKNLEWTTHTANVASPAWLWLNLQKVFHRVSTRVNCRLTITSRMAWKYKKNTSSMTGRGHANELNLNFKFKVTILTNGLWVQDSWLPHSVLCTAAGSSLCAPTQCLLEVSFAGGRYLGTLEELLMRLNTQRWGVT